MYRLSLFCAQDLETHELFSMINAARRASAEPAAASSQPQAENHMERTGAAAGETAAAARTSIRISWRRRLGRLLSRLMAEPPV